MESAQPSDGPATLQYARDQFGHKLQLAMGHASPHDAYAHLYINGMYWGLYHRGAAGLPNLHLVTWEPIRIIGTHAIRGQ